MALKDLALGLQLEKVDEIVLNAREVRPGSVAHGGQEHAGLRVALGHLLGVLRRQGIVPQAEEAPDLVLGDGLAHRNELRHDARVVVLDFPDPILLDIVVGVTSLHLVTRGPHGELGRRHGKKTIQAVEKDADSSIAAETQLTRAGVASPRRYQHQTPSHHQC